MEKKIQVAYQRLEEMEARKEEFLNDYRETGNKLSLELANEEQENMNKLTENIMKAKKN